MSSLKNEIAEHLVYLKDSFDEERKLNAERHDVIQRTLDQVSVDTIQLRNQNQRILDHFGIT